MSDQQKCDADECQCGPTAPVSRRAFLSTTGLGAAGVLAAGSGGAMAGPFTAEDTQWNLVPEDKKLSQPWLDSLTSRTTPEVYQGNQLAYVGFPIGGICCGQLYLAGDGRLWLWDIFHSRYQSDYGGMSMGEHYADPPKPGAVGKNHATQVQQGFSLRITRPDGSSEIRTLDAEGFSEISFRGEYPIAKVTYRDQTCPVEVDLQAYSPFAPLNARDSALPATLFEFSIRNRSDERISVELVGYVQNAVCPLNSDPAAGKRENRFVMAEGAATVAMSASLTEKDAQQNESGFGSMALSVRDANCQHSLAFAPPAEGATEFGMFSPSNAAGQDSVETSFDARPLGALKVSRTLAEDESWKSTFALTWFFPRYANVHGEFATIKDIDKLQRHYAARFDDATAVAQYVWANHALLAGQTQEWNRTWYDSTLPHWLLDRTFIGVNCLATETCHWFDNGRFYGWEGVACCPGTCQHVWNYAQVLAHIFPSLERTTRENIDYGMAYQNSGELWYRAEAGKHIAHDGQMGTIVRAYREHTLAEDSSFLKRIWPKVKRSIEFLIQQDQDRDGLFEGKQYNTLDQAWQGPMGWISSMYLASLRAGQAMALEMDDTPFAATCKQLYTKGSAKIVETLFDGEYFIHRPPNFESTNTNIGCHIDQVFGQSLAWQTGLGRVTPRDATLSALESLWKYNFSPDAGGYHKAMRKGKKIIKAGRWYAMPGEAGLLMCTWPKGGAENASGLQEGRFDTAVGYFNECMNGFEYQVASHMIYEGAPDSDLVQKGLAITRAIHDRYAADKRNPFNEIECSDHYARSMAGYGVFLALCGFEHHGPLKSIGFAPRITPENFKSAFTAAQGWGSYSQQRDKATQRGTIDLKQGRLELLTLALQAPASTKIASCEATLGESRIEAQLKQTGERVELTFVGNPVVVTPDSGSLAVTLKLSAS